MELADDGMREVMARVATRPEAQDSTPPDPVVAWVERARDGDREAFAKLYTRYRSMVHGVVLASVPGYEVRDLVQDAFTRAWAKLGELREASSFGPWLGAIARRGAADFHRRPRAQVLPERVGRSPQLAESLALLEAIRSLSPTYRETLVLRLVEGMTGPEIAALTGMTHRSVRVNLHRGMSKLRERLAGTETEG